MGAGALSTLPPGCERNFYTLLYSLSEYRFVVLRASVLLTSEGNSEVRWPSCLPLRLPLHPGRRDVGDASTLLTRRYCSGAGWAPVLLFTFGFSRNFFHTFFTVAGLRARKREQSLAWWRQRLTICCFCCASRVWFYSLSFPSSHSSRLLIVVSISIFVKLASISHG